MYDERGLMGRGVWEGSSFLNRLGGLEELTMLPSDARVEPSQLVIIMHFKLISAHFKRSKHCICNIFWHRIVIKMESFWYQERVTELVCQEMFRLMELKEQVNQIRWSMVFQDEKFTRIIYSWVKLSSLESRSGFCLKWTKSLDLS